MQEIKEKSPPCKYDLVNKGEITALVVMMWEI
jgi:hypothetical protein